MTSHKQFSFIRKLITLIFISVLIVSAGCSRAANDPVSTPAATQGTGTPGLNPANSPVGSLVPSPTPTSVPVQSAIPTQSAKPTATPVDAQKQDKALTTQLTAEKIVESGQVYVTGHDVVAIIMVKKGTANKTSIELATKYANTMKQKYAAKKINSHAFLDGKEVAHVTL